MAELTLPRDYDDEEDTFPQGPEVNHATEER